MMEEFYDEILKACGAIPSIYFSPMPAVSTIAANGAIKFHRDSMHARQCALEKFHRVHCGKTRAAA
jgi:hypothetical protein